MPETRPPIDLAGQSLDELAARIAERACPRSSAGTRRIAATARCASPATAPGITRASRSAAPAMVRLFSTVLRREPDGSHVLVTPVEKLTIEVEATAFRALDHDHGGRRRGAPHRLRARQRRRGHRRPRSSAERGRHADGPSRASPSATGSRPSSPARSITSSPTSRSPRATTRPASGPAAPSFRSAEA